MNVEVDISLGGTGGTSGGMRLSPLCGTGSCIPDDPTACELVDSGTGGSMGGMGGMGGMGSLYDGTAGLSANPGELDSVSASCLVSEGKRTCQRTGAKLEGQPCVAVTDCAPGLACVGEGVSGVCRQYCCEGTAASCGDSTYCNSRPIIGESKTVVPVCSPVDQCSLSEEYPCLSQQECTCSGKLACIVVRADGQTACAVPGPLRAGDRCDPEGSDQCGHGLVCSAELGCLQICSTQKEENECEAGQLCQTPPSFPAALGVCVGKGSSL